MFRVGKLLMFGLMLSTIGSANALTFKSDGSVVQKSGKVEIESFANRFRNEMSKPTNGWAKSTGIPRQIKGYFGDDALIPGAPLLRIQGIKKGEEYLEAVYRLNGLKTKSLFTGISLQMPDQLFLKTLACLRMKRKTT